MEASWMSTEEAAVCIQIASGEPPYSQRAQALLALNAGASQAEAAAQSSLTENQVRYWLSRFRSRRLSVFPEEMITAVPKTTTPAVKVDEVVAEAAEVVIVEKSADSAETAVAAKSKKKKEKDKKEMKRGTNMKKKEEKKKSVKKKDTKKKKSSKKSSKGKSKKSKKKAKKK